MYRFSLKQIGSYKMSGEQRSYAYGLYMIFIAHFLTYNFSTVNLYNDSITNSQILIAKFKIKRAQYIITNRTRTYQRVRSEATGVLKDIPPCLFIFSLETIFPPIRKRPPRTVTLFQPITARVGPFQIMKTCLIRISLILKETRS